MNPATPSQSIPLTPDSAKLFCWLQEVPRENGRRVQRSCPVDAAIVGVVDTVQLDAEHEGELASSRRK